MEHRRKRKAKMQAAEWAYRKTKKAVQMLERLASSLIRQLRHQPRVLPGGLMFAGVQRRMAPHDDVFDRDNNHCLDFKPWRSVVRFTQTKEYHDTGGS